MKNSQTIAFFSGYYLPFLGGIERYTDKLSEELVRLGYRVVIVTTNHDQLPNKVEEEGRTIYRLPSKKLFQQRYPLLDKNAVFHDLMKQIEAEEIDAVICNTRFQLTTLLGLQFAKKHHLPSFVLDHGSSHFTVNNAILDFFGAIYEHLLTARIKRFKPRFYGVSQRCCDWLRHFRIEADGVIYNSVPADLDLQFAGKSYLPKEEGQIFITYAGRMLKEKGIEMLLEAFSGSHFPEHVQLQIAGDGPEFERLQEQYASSQIHFLGRLDFDGTMSLMAQSDIFVYPSMYPEGLPTSILEAGILGNAIIATDRGGTIEVIHQADQGIIMEETVASLQSALKTLVEDDTLRSRMQDAIHQRVKTNFTWTVTAEKVATLLVDSAND
ncbi:glycosyltransferase family 4 protein [Streptococcus sp. DD13]|uniref:glycosyltransferase family 4 protein n=1 Tax=Streptococcus sp. DD13 TaxID=1777881 RepID=UPI0007912524|nr:glycosyltransferase family 4 protein [Streptococcus sp. DD13]KXT79153.1 transferase [Streptococcus sp. DD13]